MVKLYLLVLSFVCVLAKTVHRSDLYSTELYILNDGYPAETHHVTTADGYILEMHRIPHGRNQQKNDMQRPVVFVMHGLLARSNCFIFLGPEYSIAYNLADAGFDVWMGNARGTISSRYHTVYDPDDLEEKYIFFDFSFEEIGMIDIPTMIDYVLDHTGKEKLHYIGHSQGGTVFLVLNSMRPEYNEKFLSANLLAGVGYMEHFPDRGLRMLARVTDIIYSFALVQGLVEIQADLINSVVGDSNSTSNSYSDYCFGDIKYKSMCSLTGIKNMMDTIDLDDIQDLQFFLGGAALKQIAHYGQNVRDKEFRRWHYGRRGNVEVYGTADPPSYNLSLITVPTIMHYTLNDNLLDERDVLAMANDMPMTEARKIERESFTHVDFVTALDAKDMVTVYVIENILKMESLQNDQNNEAEAGESDNEINDPIEVTDPAGNSAYTFNIGTSRMYLIMLSIYLFTALL